MTVGKAMRFQMPTKMKGQMGGCALGAGGEYGGSGACGGLGGSPGGKGGGPGGKGGHCNPYHALDSGSHGAGSHGPSPGSPWQAPTARTRPQIRTTEEMRMSQWGWTPAALGENTRATDPEL